MRLNMSGLRFALLIVALCVSAWGIFSPHVRSLQDRAEVMFVIDITGSMNVRDYGEGEKLHSRLEQVRQTLGQALGRMACGSRVGLSIFTERRSFMLLEPVEVCENYAPLSQAVAQLDWRMAWEGDSYISKGLESGIELAESLGVGIVFFSDGQEAPPLPLAQAEQGHMMMQGEAQTRAAAITGGQSSDGGQGDKVKGLIVGVGSKQLSPIPRYDETGRQIGFYGEDDVEQENRSGPPPADAANREGWHARNAPFGSQAAKGNEHLSSVKDTYLQKLAGAHGLTYVSLSDSASLLRAIDSNANKHQISTSILLAPYLAAIAAGSLFIFYLTGFVRAGFASRRARRIHKRGVHTPAQSVSFNTKEI